MEEGKGKRKLGEPLSSSCMSLGEPLSLLDESRGVFGFRMSWNKKKLFLN
jgi:hypothetical protein